MEMDADQNRAKGLGPKIAWQIFKERTTAHGIPHIDNASGITKKIFWITVTSVASFFLLWNMYLIFVKFFDYPVVVKIKMLHAQQLNFPTVTVCNMNPIKKSLVSNNPTLEQALNGESRKRREIQKNVQSRQKRSTGNCQTGAFSDGSTTWCYFVPPGTGQLTHEESKQACNERGNDPLILVLDTNAKINHIKTIFPQTNGRTYWLNAKTKGRSGKNWSWFGGHGDKVTVGNLSGSGDCLFMDPQTNYDFFADECSSSHLLICQREITNATTVVDTNTPDQTTAQTPAVVGTSIPDPSTSTKANTFPQVDPLTILTTKATPKAVTPAEPPVSFEDQPQRESFVKAEVVTGVLADLSVDEKSSLGYTLDDLILDCTFTGRTCLQNDIEMFFNPLHGNCFKFNYKAQRKAYKSGRRFGLEMIMNIQQDEYIDTSGDVAGARVVAHNHRNMPFPEDDGIILQPGILTSVGIKQFDIARQGGIYSGCITDSVNQKDSDLFSEKYGTQYTQAGCSKTCYQRELTTACGCADPLYPMEGVALGNKSFSSCDSKNTTIVACKRGVYDAFNENSFTCICPALCSETHYTTSISLGEWPNENKKDEVLSALELKIGKTLQNASDPLKYKRNLLKMEVYFEELNWESIHESPAYVWSQFLSDIGGLLGLWIGFSVITVFEFIELALDMIALGMFSCCSRCVGSREGNEIRPAEKGDANPPPPKQNLPIKGRQLKERSKTKNMKKIQDSTPIMKEPNLYKNLQRWSRRQSSIPTVELV